MVVSVHIAEVDPRAAAEVLLRPPRPARVPGLTYVETTTTAALGEPLLPPRNIGRVGMIAAWENDAALERFSHLHPIARHLARGWEVRLQPLRVFGAWAGMPELPAQALPVDEEEPVGILTLGRLRLRRLGAFRRAAAPAESAAIDDPALLAGIGLARPPASSPPSRSGAALPPCASTRSGPKGPAKPRSRPTAPGPSTTNPPSSAFAPTPPRAAGTDATHSPA